jgi:hypothetical protein
MIQKINMLGYEFSGPYSINGDFNEVAGIYVITSDSAAQHKIDIGETENLKERIPNHERRDCWTRHNGIYLWFHLENNEDSRLEKEKKLRDCFDPPCGEI